jgi:hypothetical protein
MKHALSLVLPDGSAAMNDPWLFHYSEQSDLKVLHPRSPLRHPNSELLVYAIDEWHSPLYLFPRECPRIGWWPIATTTEKDRQSLVNESTQSMKIAIDRSWMHRWLSGTIYEYTFDAIGFENTGDHGVHVNQRATQVRLARRIDDLRSESIRRHAKVEIVESLVRWSTQFYDFDNQRFTTTLHVSMIRMSNLDGWPGSPGRPTSRQSNP